MNNFPAQNCLTLLLCCLILCAQAGAFAEPAADTGEGNAKEGAGAKAAPADKASDGKESASAVESSPARAEKGPQNGDGTAAGTTAPIWHKVKMKVSGSMCLACLKEFERKLNSIQGVRHAVVDRGGPALYQYYSNPGSVQYAMSTIEYDAATVQLPQLLGFIKTQGYHPYKIIDKMESR